MLNASRNTQLLNGLCYTICLRIILTPKILVQFCYLRLFSGIECFLSSVVTDNEFSTEIQDSNYPCHIVPLNLKVKNQDSFSSLLMSNFNGKYLVLAIV